MTLALASCDYLDREPIDSISKEQFFATANATALEQYCNNFYPDLIVGHNIPKGYNFGMMEADLTSDDVLPWTRNATSFGLHLAPSSATDTEWNFEIIRACNDFLDNYENSPESQTVKEKYAGMILFFKTMDYFNKLSTYGDVPWYEHVVNPGDADLYKARDPRETVADNMLRDIDQAITWLPNSSDVTVVGKQAALALKARFCLFEASWRRYHSSDETGAKKFYGEAIKACTTLMGSDYNYSLFQGSAPSKAYYELFIQADYANNPEIILSKAYDPSLSLGNNLTRQIFVNETPIGLSKACVDNYLCAATGLPITQCGCEGHTHRTTLIAELANRDPRLLQTTPTPDPEDAAHGYYLNGKSPNIEKLTPNTGAVSGSATGYAVIKYYNPEEYGASHNMGTLDAPVFRYAEILLIRAEAEAEMGTITTDILNKTVNALRERVGFTHKLTMSPAVDPQLVTDYPNVSGSNATLIREIRRERRVELCAEGYRYDDIRRWACGNLLTAPRLGVYLDGMGYSDEDKQSVINTLGVDANGFVTIYSKRYAGMNPEPTFVSPKHYLFAVPTNERAKNPDLTQNEGWEN